MKEDSYNSLIGDIYKWFDNDKYYEITESGKSYIKLLINSAYGQSYSNIFYQESINDVRAKKIKRILDETIS